MNDAPNTNEQENAAGETPGGAPESPRGACEPEAGRTEPKKRSVAPLILTAAVSAAVAVAITLLTCYRFMFLDTKQSYERQLAALSEELAPPEDKTKFADLPDKLKAVIAQYESAYPGEKQTSGTEKAVLSAFISSCGDPNARVYSAEEYAELQKSGRSAGIGVTVTRSPDDRAVITWVEKDGPADKAGVLAGDAIEAVDALTLTGENYAEALGAIAGDENESLTLTLRREDRTLNVVLTRRKVTYATVHASYDAARACGYIELLSFSDKTPEEFETALTNAADAGAKKIVIDLRGCPGGSLSVLHKLLDRLLPDLDGEGKASELFFTEDAKHNIRKYVCGDEKELSLPVSVIIDNDTAHEAEVFAAVMREKANATVVGKESRGDLSLVSRYRLKDGTTLYFTSGYCRASTVNAPASQRVAPDIERESDRIRRALSPFTEDECYRAACAAAGGAAD